MKLSMNRIDPKSNRVQKVAAVLAASLVGVAVCARLAMAQVPHTFTPGQTLTAASLNENFAALDTRLTALEAAPTSVTVAGSLGEAGPGLNIPTVYTHADLVLSPGTWLVQGYAGLSITTNEDTVGLGLHNVTTGADVPNSVGALEVIATSNLVRGFTTAQTLVMASVPTTIRLKAIQNGASVPSFVDFSGPVSATLAALGPHKLTAVRLR